MTELLGQALKQHSDSIVPTHVELITPKIYRKNNVGSRLIMENAALLAATNWERVANEDVLSYIAHLHPNYNRDLILELYVAASRPSSFKTFWLLALAVFDLALMPPLLPGYEEGPVGLLGWKDLQPGYRFMKAVRILEENVIPLPRDYSGYAMFINQLCERAGWPTPEAVAKSVVESPVENLIILGQSAHIDCFRAACSLRQTVPWAIPFAMWWKTEEEFQAQIGSEPHCRLSSIFYNDGEFIVLDEGLFRKRLEIQVWKWLADNLMEKDRIDLEECYIFGDHPDLVQQAQKLVFN